MLVDDATHAHANAVVATAPAAHDNMIQALPSVLHTRKRSVKSIKSNNAKSNKNKIFPYKH